MRNRLVLSYVAVVLVVLTALEIPIGFLAARHERGLTTGQAAHEATSLAVLAGEALEGKRPEELGPLVARYRSRTGGEVVVLDASGKVIASAEADPDNDANGPEGGLVEVALEGRTASRFGSDNGRPWALAAAPIVEDSGPGGAVLVGIPADATEDRIGAIWLALILFAIGALALTAVAGLVLARSITRPLARLGKAVEGFAEGQLATRASADQGPGEIRALAEEFNRMASRLSDLLEAQNRFVADASHQLRSPLTALRLRLDNLEAGAPGPSAEGIAAASREVNRLSRIVDGLLALGRAGVDTSRRGPVDAAAVIAERCEAWSALAEEKGVQLQPQVPTGLALYTLLVPGDLEQMLDNLLANSLDAVAVGGRIGVSARALDGRQVEVRVVDNGPGMSDEDRHRAFDRFWQGPAAGPGRSGLGLAIVRQLAGRNEATVELLQAEPEGLDARLVLPAP